jgi:hypothetical protein
MLQLASCHTDINWRIVVIGDRATAQVWESGEIFRDEFEGSAPIPSIALLIAALKAMDCRRCLS